MKKYTEWNKLTTQQKIHAAEQYISLIALQEECSVEYAAKIITGCYIPEINIGENSVIQELVSLKNIEIDTDDESYIYVDL